MGYTTNFTGHFEIQPPLSEKHREFLVKFNETRRMARDLPDRFGVEGEHYVHGTGMGGQDREPTIMNYNKPPSTQPGLWCQWVPNEAGDELRWDEGEKFYHYEAWLKYLMKNYLIPWGHQLQGEVRWQGEDCGDIGIIRCGGTHVTILEGTVKFERSTEYILPNGVGDPTETTSAMTVEEYREMIDEEEEEA